MGRAGGVLLRRLTRALLIAAIMVGVSALNGVISGLEVWVVLRAALVVGLPQMDGVQPAELSSWALRIATVSALLGLSFLIIRARPWIGTLWRTGRPANAEPKSPQWRQRLIDMAVTVLAGVFVLHERIVDPVRLLTLMVLVVIVPQVALRLPLLLWRHVLRPLGRAFDRLDKETRPERRDCTTGYHHPWCGHVETDRIANG